MEEDETLKNVAINSDRKRITQVLLNLISNAFKFTFNGSIKVSVRKKDDHTLEFEVRDTGVGISKAGQKRLFKLFGKLRERSSTSLADRLTCNQKGTSEHQFTLQ